MNRIRPIEQYAARGAAADLLAEVRAVTGALPNTVKVMANSPALLRGYLGLAGALAAGELSEAVNEQLALLVAEENRCAYCLAAHSFIARRLLGLDEDVISGARRGVSSDPRTAAVLGFAAAVVRDRGGVSDDAVAAAREAGLTEGELVEIVGHVAVNVLTNYVNRLARVELDFPTARPLDEHDHAA